ncbi:hypothetical protein [Nocardia aurantiaca]|uniref:Uncharacterized protein n=1 Tax=Nocardia aurantiaca TaxID=2675850 RepID=A0A6I3L179_9NOCA|nr:hypothetical protein [Nocardia aurantiaca]MTE14324.1 hypothetical protein [Nocardia aurantiaca]
MTIRHAPLFVIALPFVVTGLELSGASPLAMLSALFILAVPFLLLLTLPGSKENWSRRR